jgi:pyridoxamine 5'-phosphate oxidase
MSELGDPFELFERWLEEATEAEGPDPARAMALATADEQGSPSVRMVMLRGFDRRGFLFFTNYDSRKGRELMANPRAAVTIYWPTLHRQVSASGVAERLSLDESAAYYRSRPLGHRLGAWASRQDEPIPDRATLERQFEQARERFGDDPPMPDYWGGFVLRPEAFEFWQGRDDRLHDRVRHTLEEGGTWRAERLSP